MGYLRIYFLLSFLSLSCFLQSSPVFAEDFKLALTGQLMIQHDLSPYGKSKYAENMKLQKIRTNLEEVFALIRRQDVVILELETALKIEKKGGLNKKDEEPQGRDKKSEFFHEVDKESVIHLIQNMLKLDESNLMVSCANNHAGDNGARGLEALIELFNDLNIKMAGIGSEEEASKPRYLPISDKQGKEHQVGLVAFATEKVQMEAKEDRVGVNTLSMADKEADTLKERDKQRILESIATARKKGALVVAYQHNHHWTKNQVNEVGEVAPWRIDFAHQCINRGASVYFSHGEPRLQGIEIYHGKPIFYGLGNFIFQTKKNGFYGPEVWESVIAEIEYGPSQIRSIKLIPLVLNEAGADHLHLETRGLPSLAVGNKAKGILKKLQGMSEKFGTHIEIDESNPKAIFGRIALDPGA